MEQFIHGVVGLDLKANKVVDRGLVLTIKHASGPPTLVYLFASSATDEPIEVTETTS